MKSLILFKIVLIAGYCSTMVSYQKITVYNTNQRQSKPLESLSLNSEEEISNGIPEQSLSLNLSNDKKSDAAESTTPMEGSLCRRSFDGRNGYCIPAFQCLHVIREHRVYRTKIDFCLRRGHIPVICCPLEEKDSHTQRISEKKCHEYHNALDGINLRAKRKFSGKNCVSSLPLIVGGIPTEVDEYPHMAAIGWSQLENQQIDWNCGGSLISKQFVLTAAHCTNSARKPPDIVRLGAQNLNTSNDNSQDYGIAKIILHPKYSFKSYYHDIALLKLNQSINFTQTTRPACLWSFPEFQISSTIATGWGQTKFLGSRSNELQKVELDLIDRVVCRKLIPSERKLSRGIADHQLCAGKLEGGKDTCQGDSGGPLHFVLPEFKCIKFLIGITSFGKYCAAPNSPGVYTSISDHLDWIEKIAFDE